MRYRIYLGRSVNGKSAGFLELSTNEMPNASLATPDALKLVSLRGVDCVRDSATGQLRQIMAAECFGTVTPVDGHAYNIAFYQPGSVAPDLDTNGWYVLAPGATPFIDYQIRNPDTTNAFERLQIVQTRDGEAKTEEFSWETDAQGRLNWTLSQGNDLKKIGLCVEPSGDNETIKTWTTRAHDGTVTAVQQKHYALLGGEPRLTKKIDDPDGAALTTQIAYVTDAASASYGAIAQTINPDGSWVTNVFNGDGIIHEERSGWLDAGPGASDDAASVTTYAYTPFLSQTESNVVDAVISTNELSVVETNYIYNVETNFWPDTGVTDRGTPRVETVAAAGVPVAKTLRVIHTDTMGYKVVEDVRLLDPSRIDLAAAYADPANPRTLTQSMPKNDIYSWSERPEYICHPDGRTESYAYVYGNYAPGETGVPGVFTESPVTGACMQVTCTHGTTNAPGGVAYQTTQEVTIETSVGRVLQSETWVCIGTTNYTRVAWRKNTLNDLGQIVATCDSTGAESETAWSCCGPESETAADGTVTETAYDALKRPVLTTREGEGSQPDLFTETAYDAAGHVTFRRTSSGGLSQTTTNTYDLAGRLTWSRGPDGIETTYLYGSNSTTTVRGGLTNLSVRFADGRTHYTEQNGVRRQTYAYGVNPDGTQWTTVFTGPDGTNSAAWQKTVTDPLGRAIAQIRPGFGAALLVTSNHYDTANHLVRTERWTSGVECRLLDVQLFTYDTLGNPLLTCQNLDLDGEIDLAGPDRVTGQATRYAQLSGDWHQESVSWIYPADGSAAPLTNAVARTRLTGLGIAYSADGATGILTAESVSIDARSNATTSRTVVDRDNKTVYQVSDTPDSSVAALTVTVNGLVQASRSTHNLTTTYAYDALGRIIATQDARGGMHSRGYDDAGRAAWESDPATNGTWYAYDALGRRTAVTNALGQVTRTAYDPEGRTLATWGATYPVAYEYDDHGRMTAMATTRDPAHESVNLLTLLPAGVHLSDPSHPSYPSALDTTRWYYDSPTGLLTNKLYADDKGTAYTYTPDGKLATRAWARGVTTSYAYTNGSSLASIDYSDDTPDVAFTYDRLGRQVSAVTAGVSTYDYGYSSFGLLTNETVTLCASAPLRETITRTYDSLGRESGFSLGADYEVAYGYNDFGRFHSVSSTVASAKSEATYAYLAGSDLLAGMTNSWGFSWKRTYETNRNLIASVENRFRESPVSRFDYTNDSLARRTNRVDNLNVTNDFGYNIRSEVVSADMGANDYSYAYDPIGNRLTATNNGTGWNYLSNPLNQYTNIADGVIVEPEYDLDGNMNAAGDGWWYFWNGENRMILASNDTTVVTYAYDHQGRMVAKTVDDVARQYLWDGYNIVQNTIDNQPSTTNHYVWGLDLSGSLQGAGGAGGLLEEIQNREPYFAAFDANGNVTECVSTNGVTEAHYEYSPFGEIVVQSGDLADSFTHRFSTKPWCGVTGLSEYLFRKYEPGMGRWLSRDPIGERGGGNLYRCVMNTPIIFVDPLGLWETGKDWPTKCGNCSVKYEKKSLPGEGGELAPGGYSWGLPSVTTCGGGTGPSDPSRFSISYPNTECTATVWFDPNTDPSSIIPGVDISFLSHEQKHVECMANAYDWALAKLGELSKRCCCNTGPMTSLAGLIQATAGLKRISCNSSIDCEDYKKATNPDLKKDASIKCDRAAKTAAIVVNRVQQIDQALKDLETCK